MEPLVVQQQQLDVSELTGNLVHSRVANPHSPHSSAGVDPEGPEQTVHEDWHTEGVRSDGGGVGEGVGAWVWVAVAWDGKEQG